MASFRKIGGRTRNLNKFQSKTEPQSNVEPRPTNHEMHIAQIQSEQNQSVFYPLMSDNETPRYFEDAGLYYCFNQTVQDFVLNADHISATNIFNVDTLAFADGSTMSSAFQEKEEAIYNVYVELDADESKQVELPTCGVYLVTFCVHPGAHLTIQLKESCFTQTNSGSLTVHYDKRFAHTDDELIGKNQTSSPYLDFNKKNDKKNDKINETATKQNAHITITRIA